VVGAEGGRTIINTVLQVILNSVDHEMNIGEAIEAGRFHHQWLPDAINFESFTLSNDVQKLLREKGHVLRQRKWHQGSATGIQWEPQKHMLMGAADSRIPDSGAEGY
jgi:gamma-glutamyltranspeptidase/glutathione hydrolase